MQAWEALDATEAELSATKARLASANEAIEAAREREDRLLKILEKRQIRLPQLVMTVAATAAMTVILTLVAVHYMEAFWPTGQTRTAAVENNIAGAERHER